ncbi:hypothetical protein AV530_007707 [Patagioenas fasciata monilis]|uniref:Uncharacterized protein n=1 Tax=Patagioenas fasciata monilis TaxID=372326 RepID=A0A1V4JYT2_PATFA|nr:hypothetical protein AV530_007707 [Patagioenas fasciata monilis]
MIEKCYESKELYIRNKYRNGEIAPPTSGLQDRKKLYENPDNLDCDNQKDFSVLSVQTCLVQNKWERDLGEYNPVFNTERGWNVIYPEAGENLNWLR